MASGRVGYVALLRHNRSFRYLWYGQVASQLGDWLDTIALFTLLLRQTGSASALAGLLIAQSLPAVVVGPIAGVLVDRLPRKSLLIVTDLCRAALVPLFLLVRGPEDLWLAYGITFLKFAVTSVYEPAREAIVPDVVPRDDLVAANALSGLTWSVMLAGGAALGGLLAATLGTELSFLADSLSFALSAVLTVPVIARDEHLRQRVAAHPLKDLRDGLAYLGSRRDVAVYALCKTFWAVGGGGVLVLLPLVGTELFPLGAGGALSMGLLYAARGVGAGIGPVVAGKWSAGRVPRLRRCLGPAFLVLAVGYLLLAGAPSLALAAVALALAHFGSSIQWVFSTTLLQMEVPGRLQGRVFAAEMIMLTLVACASSYLAGLLSDHGWSPQALAGLISLSFLPTGVAMTLCLWRPPRVQAVE